MEGGVPVLDSIYIFSRWEKIKVLLGQALASNGPPDRCI